MKNVKEGFLGGFRVGNGTQTSFPISVFLEAIAHMIFLSKRFYFYEKVE